MARRHLPDPLFKPGDEVFLNCSRKGLNIGNAVFGKIVKSRWHYGYDYWVVFHPKGLGQVIVKLHEGCISPKAEYAEFLLENKIREIGSYKKTMAAYALRDKKESATREIQELKAQIQKDRNRLKLLKIVQKKCNAKLKKLIGK